MFFPFCVTACHIDIEILRPLLASYRRAFSVVEIGITQASPLLVIAKEYESTCIGALDGVWQQRANQEWLDVVRSAPIIYLDKPLDREDICCTLGHNQHYDILIFLGLTERSDWHQWMPYIAKMADHIVIFLPVCEQNEATLRLLQEHRAKELCVKHRKSLYLLQGKPPTIRQGGRKKCLVPLVSNFWKKYFVKKDTPHHWTHGMGLNIFLELEGKSPQRSCLKHALLESSYEEHDDAMPWNCIVTKQGIEWIDKGKRFNGMERVYFAYTLACLRCKTQQEYRTFHQKRWNWMRQYKQLL